MSIHRIYGIMLRFLFILRRNFDRQVQMLFYPVIDLILWGLTSSYVESFSTEQGINGVPFFLTMVISGIVLWTIIHRTCEEIPYNVLEELWHRNLLNIFISPLSFAEWITAFLLLTFFKLLITISITGLLALLLYQVNVFLYGFYLLPFFALLMMTGWWIGFLVTGMILRYGTSIQAIAWSFGFIIAPFSGIYYPIASLPAWAQSVASVLPTSYIFEGMREVLRAGTMNTDKLLISLGLNLVFLTVTVLYMRKGFLRRLNKGLLSLE